MELTITTPLTQTQALAAVRAALPELAQFIADDMADGIELAAENLNERPVYVPARLRGGPLSEHTDPFSNAPLSTATAIFRQRATGGPGVDTGAMVAMLRSLPATATHTPNSITLAPQSLLGKLLVDAGSNRVKDPVDYYRIYEATYGFGPIFGISARVLPALVAALRARLQAR